MSENKEFTEPTEQSLKELSHKRILLIMAIVAVVGSILGFVFVSKFYGIGILIGGILSFVNYYWMKHSLKGIFERAIRGENPKLMASSYVFRYVGLGLILIFIYLSKSLDMVSVLLGLLSFAVAVMLEGFIRIFLSFSKQKEI